LATKNPFRSLPRAPRFVKPEVAEALHGGKFAWRQYAYLVSYAWAGFFGVAGAAYLISGVRNKIQQRAEDDPTSK